MATRFAAFENKMNSLATQAKTSNTENVIKSIPMSQIDENTLNDKTFSMNNIETLAAYIKKVGSKEPIRVRQTENGRYEIIAGHRRFRANQLNSAKYIDAIIGNEKTEEEAIDSLVMSNVLSRRLSPIDDARSMQLWIDKVLPALREREEVSGNTKDIVAKKWGVSPSSVSRRLSLLKLIPELQHLIEKKGMDYSVLLPVCQIDTAEQKSVYKAIKDLDSEDITAAYVKSLIGEESATSVPVKEESTEDKKEKQQRVKSTTTATERAVTTFLSSMSKVSELSERDLDSLKKLREDIDTLISEKS